MKLIETESGGAIVAGDRSGGTSSPAVRGEGKTHALVASSSFVQRLRALCGSVWAPLLAKAAGVLAGMLALAAIGASSLARGSGVALPATSSQPGRAGAAVASLAAPSLARTQAQGLEAEPSDAGAAPSDSGAEAPKPPSDAVTSDGKIILNLATESDLRHLPGIGAKRAAAILALRAKLGGRFKRVSELLRVKGIGAKGLKKIEPRVVLDAPKPA